MGIIYVPAQLSGRHEGDREAVNEYTLSLGAAFNDFIMLTVDQGAIPRIIDIRCLIGRQSCRRIGYGQGQHPFPAAG